MPVARRRRARQGRRRIRAPAEKSGRGQTSGLPAVRHTTAQPAGARAATAATRPRLPGIPRRLEQCLHGSLRRRGRGAGQDRRPFRRCDVAFPRGNDCRQRAIGLTALRRGVCAPQQSSRPASAGHGRRRARASAAGRRVYLCRGGTVRPDTALRAHGHRRELGRPRPVQGRSARARSAITDRQAHGELAPVAGGN